MVYGRRTALEQAAATSDDPLRRARLARQADEAAFAPRAVGGLEAAAIVERLDVVAAVRHRMSPRNVPLALGALVAGAIGVLGLLSQAQVWEIDATIDGALRGGDAAVAVATALRGRGYDIEPGEVQVVGIDDGSLIGGTTLYTTVRSPRTFTFVRRSTDVTHSTLKALTFTRGTRKECWPIPRWPSVVRWGAILAGFGVALVLGGLLFVRSD
jgi:hypothetical protein